MAVAKVFPETSQGKRTSLETGEVGRNQLSQARTVLRYAPEKGALVLSGAEALDAAYKEAKTLQRNHRHPTALTALVTYETNSRTASTDRRASLAAQSCPRWTIK